LDGRRRGILVAPLLSGRGSTGFFARFLTQSGIFMVSTNCEYSEFYAETTPVRILEKFGNPLGKGNVNRYPDDKKGQW
jgi:hypothetical protein